MSRKKAREGLVSLMYQSLFYDELNSDNIELYLDNFKYSELEKQYIKQGYDLITKNKETIDETISKNLKKWSFERIYKLDLSILRVAVFEILFSDNVPNEVAINEAVEIAKKFGTNDSSKLINGILGTIIRSWNSLIFRLFKFMLNFKVSELLNYIKEITNKDFILSKLAIEGEISNLTLHNSGNAYFSIKDEYSKISCILYNYSSNENIKNMKNGDQVLLKGKLNVLETDGSIRIAVENIENIGIGKCYENFIQTKNELEKLGYFSDEHKKEIPKFLKKIGVITSSDGAAIKDIISVTKRRNPYISIILFSANVQGPSSVTSLINGLEYFSQSDVDLVIIGRGGGSYEDLDSFNSRELALKIYNFNKPIISSVGHEIDYVISDFVSDLRAPTPSAAAELAAFDHFSNIESIENKLLLIEDKIELKLEKNFEKLKVINNRLDLLSIAKVIDYKKEKLTNLAEKIKNNAFNKIKLREAELSSIPKKLNKDKIINKLSLYEYSLEQLILKSARSIDKRYLDAEKNLLLLNNRLEKLDIKTMQKKGYSLIVNSEFNLIKDVNAISINEELEILLSNGELRVKVLSKKEY